LKILLVSPKNPDTFWSFHYALKFASKKSSFPPLGLLTVAAMLPRDWEVKLVDMNTTALEDADLAWADWVFLTAISVHRDSATQVIGRCRKLGVKVVAGGPLMTTSHADFPEVDHFVLNEAEIPLPLFLEDLARGQAKRMYTTRETADLALTPLPRWDLIRLKPYASVSIQYSRGCPFNCDFCDITALYGRHCRTKSAEQIIAELNQLERLGWRGSVFFVDDNFIGNTAKLKKTILPAIVDWMEAHRRPFTFFTQASINLADDAELMALMTRAGFNMVFIGIESPNESSLAECSKNQNKNRDLLAAVHKCQRAGLQVQGGFIVGFDSDPISIFAHHIAFIQKSGIVTAMVGILNALKGTRLYERMEQENRLLTTSTGNNTDCSLNFVPRMNRDALVAGYRKIIANIYAPRNYYDRVIAFLKRYRRPLSGGRRLDFAALAAFVKSIIRLGVLGRERLHYWRLLAWTLFRRPRSLPLAVTLAIYGFHFRKIFKSSLQSV